MPLQPGPQHRRLAALAGQWSGQSDTFPNPWGPGGKAMGIWSFRMDGASLHLLHDYREEREGSAAFEGHGVLMIDPQTDTPLWFWFDSYGFPPLHPSRGVWDGDVLTLHKVTPRGEGRTVFCLEGDMLKVDTASRTSGAPDFAPVSSGLFHRR